jgi:RNA-directed DNA polymerase
MTAKPKAGAVSHGKVNWQAIDWRKVYRNVRRLQARIVKATREGRWGKVKALQWLLTHSLSGRCLAVRRVTENQGQRTPGVDNIIWDTPKKKAQAVQALKRRGYQAQPLRRVYIPKSNGQKMRGLGIPTMADRAQQALHLLALDPIAETTADPNSYGFRNERSTADAIVQCFIVLSRGHSAEYILEGDIKSCFDEIGHAWLVKHIPMDKTILQKWLKAGFIEKHVRYPTNSGTPQGGIISPVLMTMTLNGLEKELQRIFKSTCKGNPKVHLIKYADDFIATGNTKEVLENEVKPIIEQFLKERRLQLSPEKTKITHIADGFDFLGQNVRKYQGKLLIKPSAKNVKAFLEKVRRLIKGQPQATAGHLIGQLNPILRGWANYHRHVVSKETFQSVDHAIFQALWQWAKRRHPTKNAQWVRKKYFRTVGGYHWIFFGQVTRKNGETKEIQLLKAGQISIKRHVKIKAEANPYDREWETYFERRRDIKMANNLKHRVKLLYLWKEQNGLCPICQQKITKRTGWNNHHIVWRTNGGGDGAENRVLLHPTCHSQVHSQGLKVVKPRPVRGVRKA